MPFFIRKNDLEARIGNRPFLALPTEELERLFGTIEVLPKKQPDALRLCTITLAHRNYRWLTFPSDKLYLRTESEGGSAPLFLDDTFAEQARGALDSLRLAVPYELRLAGLLIADAVSIVYVARLLADGPWPQLGRTDLEMLRHDFDATSRLLITQLDAF